MRIKLIEFRIYNFRCIDDSDWIRVDDITALVGVNESGKTALLNALHTLNPGSGKVDINYIRDFPRERLSSEYSKDCKLAEGRLLIPKEYLIEKQLIKEFNLVPEKDLVLNLTRKYSKTLYYDFESELGKKYIPPLKTILQETRKKINRKLLDDALQKLESIQSEDSIKSNEEGKATEPQKPPFTEEVQKLIVNQIDVLLKKLETGYESETVFQFTKERGEFAEFLDKHNKSLGKVFNSAKAELAPLLDLLEKIINELRGKSEQTKLYERIKPDLPVFIYFEDYNILPGSILISNLVKAIKGDVEFQGFKIQEILFKHVGLNPLEIYNLGVQNISAQREAELNQQIRRGNDSARAVSEAIMENISPEKQEELKKRKILLDSASQLMTKTLNKYFQEREYEVVYDTDGQFLQILISDRLKPSKINLENRSKGFRWYFSFFLVFLVESGRMLKNAILLLDEPGIHLHLQAQFNLINFFQKLKETNQIIYTTHSPFLIDENHLEQVRSVFEDEEGITRVTEDNLIPDKKSVFPLQAALSYRTSQVIYQGLKQLLVEGDSDYNYIKFINSVLTKLNKKSLDKDIVIVPCKSASKIEMYARLFIDLENIPVVLLDSDKAGEEAYDKLTTSLFAEHKKNVLMTGEFLESGKGSEIEDLIGRKILINCLNFHNLAEPLVSESELGDGPFVDALVSYCKKTQIQLKPDWKIQLSLKLKNSFIEKDSESILKEIPEDEIGLYANLIQKINQYAEKKHKD